MTDVSNLMLNAPLGASNVPPTGTAAIPASGIGISPEVLRKSPVEVSWARHLDEVRQAQRLRFQVFATEMGARLTTPIDRKSVV